MATGTSFHFYEPVTTAHTTQKFPLGFRRMENGKEYTYMKAGAAIAINEAVKLDTADTTGGTVKKTAAVADPIFGVAESVALASGEYGWITTRGPVSVLILDAVAAEDLLGASATAGTLQAAAAGNVDHIRVMALEDGVVANSTKACYIF